MPLAPPSVHDIATPRVDELTPAANVFVVNRPVYERQAEHLDPLGVRFGAVAARRALAIGGLATLASLLIVLVFVAIAHASSGITGSLLLLVWIGSFLAYLLLRIPISLSEWKTLIEEKGGEAQEVFGHAAYVMRRRKVPAASLRVRAISQPGHPRHDYLEVRHGILTGYVTCFPYGTDLYIGWTLWWRFSPLHYVAMAIGRRWQIYTMRGSELHLLYRYDIAKAMREAIHAATGEAVDAARGLRKVQPMPSDIPVEAIEMRSQRWDPALAPRAGG